MWSSSALNYSEVSYGHVIQVGPRSIFSGFTVNRAIKVTLEIMSFQTRLFRKSGDNVLCGQEHAASSVFVDNFFLLNRQHW